MSAAIVRCSDGLLARLKAFLSEDRDEYYARVSQLMLAVLLHDGKARGLVGPDKPLYIDYSLLCSDELANHPHFLSSSECHEHLASTREGRLLFRMGHLRVFATTRRLPYRIMLTRKISQVGNLDLDQLG